MYKYVYTYVYMCIHMTGTETVTLLGRAGRNLKDGCVRGTYRLSVALQSATSS